MEGKRIVGGLPLHDFLLLIVVGNLLSLFFSSSPYISSYSPLRPTCVVDDSDALVECVADEEIVARSVDRDALRHEEERRGGVGAVHEPSTTSTSHSSNNTWKEGKQTTAESKRRDQDRKINRDGNRQTEGRTIPVLSCALLSPLHADLLV